MSVDEGKTFNYLGMNIKMREDKKIEIEMKYQLLETISMFE